MDVVNKLFGYHTVKCVFCGTKFITKITGLPNYCSDNCIMNQYAEEHRKKQLSLSSNQK